MIDVTQFILISVVVSLTVVLIIIGIQTISILKEFKISISKMNKILDDANTISSSVAKPISAASGFLLGLRGGRVINSAIKILRKHKKEE